MRIAVLIKSIPDSAAEGAETAMNPYDEYALEEAVRLKEKEGAEVIALTLGGDSAVKVLRTALAFGADQAVLIREKPGSEWTGRNTARVLAAALERFGPDLLLAGKQAIDGDGAQVAERVAEHLGLPHASAVSRLQFSPGKIEVDREVEGGHYVLEMALPALATVEKGINTPRYPALPHILKAKTKPIVEISQDDLGVEPQTLKPRLRTERFVHHRAERRGEILEGNPSDAVGRLAILLSQNVGGSPGGGDRS